MKSPKILLLSALALVLGVTSSCNKDDDDNNELNLPAATLTGKWFYSKVGTNAGGNEILVNYPDNEDGCSKDYILVGDNNVFTDVDFDSTDTPCAQNTSAGTYAVTSNTIVIDYGGDTETGTILGLSYTELKIQYSDGTIYVYTRE